MTDIIFNSHDYETLLADAERLGFTQTDAEGNVTIITNGSLGGTGGWFLNIVGTVYEPVTPPENPEDPWPAPVPREGYWGRLRLNGDTSGVPPFDPSITQYVWNPDVGPVNPETGMHSGGWTDDGVTLAPDWVGNIGQIA